MKNITFRIEDERLIKQAKLKAISLNRSLNDLFTEWLKMITNDKSQDFNYKKYITKYSHIKIDKKFSRAEMNER
jgi:hypothetical protein